METSKEITAQFLRDWNERFGTNVKIKDKHTVWWMWVLTVVVFPFNQDFMRGYVTTIGSTIYIPKGFWDDRNWARDLEVIWHECVHVLDSKRLPVLYEVSYLFPQILLPVPVLVTWLWLGLPWWAVLASAVALLVPVVFPAPWRCWWEVRAYRTQILSWNEIWRTDIPPLQEHILTRFTGSDYYWMGTVLKGWITNLLGDLDGKWKDEDVYQFGLDWLNRKMGW